MSIDRGRWTAYGRGSRPAGGRWLSALAIVLVLIGSLGWAAKHPVGACSCGRVHLAPAIGAPVGVYRGRGFALVLYGARRLRRTEP